MKTKNKKETLVQKLLRENRLLKQKLNAKSKEVRQVKKQANKNKAIAKKSKAIISREKNEAKKIKKRIYRLQHPKHIKFTFRNYRKKRKFKPVKRFLYKQFFLKTYIAGSTLQNAYIFNKEFAHPRSKALIQKWYREFSTSKKIRHYRQHHIHKNIIPISRAIALENKVKYPVENISREERVLRIYDNYFLGYLIALKGDYNKLASKDVKLRNFDFLRYHNGYYYIKSGSP